MLTLNKLVKSPRYNLNDDDDDYDSSSSGTDTTLPLPPYIPKRTLSEPNFARKSKPLKESFNKDFYNGLIFLIEYQSEPDDGDDGDDEVN